MTLKEIAAEFGISPSTVSRVINGCSKNFTVKPELRKRILDRVAESGYRPNPIFKAIRTANNRQISFLFGYRSIFRAGDTVETALDAAAEVLEEKDFGLNYLFDPFAREKNFSVPQWKPAGLIIPDVIYTRQLAALDQAGYPYVSLNGPAGSGGSAVMSDEEANMRQVLEHLYRLGHRRIGYINYNCETHLHHSVRDRETTYREFCREHGLPEIAGCEVNDIPVEVRFDDLIRQKVSAVVAYHLVIGREVVYRAWLKKIRIPEELSVITFTDSPSLRFTTPPLSCLDIAAAEMGREAARLIMAKTADAGFENGRTIRIAGKLVLRESTAPVPNYRKGNGV